MSAAFGELPLSFEANHGQTDASVDFLARGQGYGMFLRPTEAVVILKEPSGKPATEPKNKSKSGVKINAPVRVMRMKLSGARPTSTAEGLDELPGKVSYFIGNDSAKWKKSISTYGRVRYKEVYPGIDLIYYGNQQQLEYDFVLAPGARASEIALQFEGVDKVEVDASGDLLLKTGQNTVLLRKPIIHQDIADKHRIVHGRYVIRGEKRVGFLVGEYDTRAALIIDPTLVYSTYLGGSYYDQVDGIAVDAAGNTYIGGATGSTNFPTANPIQSFAGGDDDAFVAKINASGTALLYSTYLGGGSVDAVNGIAVDSSGNAYVAGATNSTDFPTVNAIQSTAGGGYDVFVSKINSSGTALIYSTYLGGGSDDSAYGIAVDSSGNAYVAGNTSSTNFPTVNAIQGTAGGSSDAFVAKINTSGTALLYSTYLGGANYDIANGIAVDSFGNAYVAGYTNSTNFPTANAIQSTTGGGYDAFVAKINTSGTTLLYSTYLGGGSSDSANAIAVDSSGNAYVAGNTSSTNFPTVNAIQSTTGGSSDAFVAKINASGTALLYSTYLGGANYEAAYGIAVDSSGNAYVAGVTGSTNFPTVNAIQSTAGGSYDAFIAKINASGFALLYSTYLGGAGYDQALAVAVDSSDNAYVAGYTNSTDFPTANAIQTTTGGLYDAFVSKIAAPVQLVSVASAKTHGSAGTFNIDLPLTGAPGIECRSGGASGNYTMVFTFGLNLASADGASVTSGTGAVSANTIDSSDSHRYIVNLTGITDAQYIGVTLSNVSDSAGNHSDSISQEMGVLIGDVNGDGVVNVGDTALVRGNAGVTLDNTNFQYDVNVDGLVNVGDTSIVKSKSGDFLPEIPSGALKSTRLRERVSLP